MNARRLFVACLILVVVARGLRCLCTDVMICAYAVATNTGAQPLYDPTETDPNESGCLCKGAIFTPPCMPVNVQSHGPALFVSDPCITLAAAVPTDRAPKDWLLRPPRSGKMLRALLATWQI